MAKACVGIFKFLLKLSCDVCSCGYGACSSKELAEGKSYYEINLLGKKCAKSDQYLLVNNLFIWFSRIVKDFLIFKYARYLSNLLIDTNKDYDRCTQKL